MLIEQISIAAVRPFDNNPRANDSAVDAVASSITEFGFLQPIVVDAGMVIIVGDTRFKAAKRLGLDSVPVHVARDLSPDQVRAYRIIDNRSNQLAEWDYAKLVGEIAGAKATGYGADLREMFDLLGRECEAALADAQEETTEADDAPDPEGMELGVNEYYDVICIVCKSVKDWNRLVDVFKLPRVKVRRSKLGLLRAVDAENVLRLVEASNVGLQDRDSVPQASREHAADAVATS